jgi:adenosylhomocysteine nucleosidase
MSATGRPIGVLAAMEQELAAIVARLHDVEPGDVGGRRFYRGLLEGRDVVAVVAGIGKTAVAATTTLLIHHWACTGVVLTGAAGRVSQTASIGDVVVATYLVHHDLDARPIFPRYQVPSLGLAELPTDPRLSDCAWAAAQRFVADGAQGRAAVMRGPVLSGDQFMGPAALADLAERFPDALAVEMEGAAVAQVCIESQTPCAVVRVISDGGDADDFERFLEHECGRYASAIIAGMVAGGA